MQNNINSRNFMKHNRSFFTFYTATLSVSGRKSATYYACIKSVPNTVLNFGLFYNIFNFYIYKLFKI